jgi:transcription antitermination factor NusG
MVLLKPVDPASIPDLVAGHRGRVSYPILKEFLESGYVLVLIDRTGMQQSLVSLTSSVSAYIRSHGLPVKLFSRGGQLYLLRTDADPKTPAKAAKLNIDRLAKVEDAPLPPVEGEVPEMSATTVKRHRAQKAGFTR